MRDLLSRRAAVLLGLIGLVLLLAVAAGTPAQAQLDPSRTVPPEALAGGSVPGNTLGSSSDADFWRAVRTGDQGYVSIPNKQAGVLVQSYGESWREFRNALLKVYGAWALLGMVGLLALFFLLRGRVRIQAGRSGRRIVRFDGLDRFAHWVTASSFVILALTGMNVLWGRYLLLPLIGPDVFSAITIAGKYAHNFVAFPFMIGLALMLVLWVGHNIPNRYDLGWLLRGGGLFSKHSHPHAKKFNAGQKILFWIVILGGISISLSGIALMFPFETHLWGKTLGFAADLGLDVPTDITPMMEMQLNSIWHAVVAVALIAVILGHIYIGTIGMEGAFEAMGSGRVDENWAKEHHDLWVAELRDRAGERPVRRRPQPAE